MKISTVFTLTLDVLNSYSKEHPKTTFNVENKTIKVKDIIASLNKLMGWLYKDLTTESIKRVIHCYDCKYYKKYKKRGDIKAVSFYACSKDRNKRRPDFYCKDGEPRI